MLLDRNLYGWKQGSISNFIIPEANIQVEHVFEQPVMLYKINGTGIIKIYTDAETLLYEGTLPFQPSEPIVCNSLFFYTEIENQELHFIGLVGEQLILISNYFNSYTSMDSLASSIDYGVYEVTMPFEGFKFDGQEVGKIYFCTDMWIGFNSSTAHLNVFNRDGKSSLYSMSKTDKGMKFLKLKSYGYTRYSSTNSQYIASYELYLLENGDMYLHVLQGPTNSSYYGTRSLVCNGKTISLTINSGTTDTYISFYRQDTEGKEWNIVYEQYPGITGDTPLYLVEKEGKFYSVIEDTLVEQPVSELNALSFVQYGSEVLPTTSLIPKNPKIYSWAPTEIYEMKWTATAYPFPQTVSFVVDMSHETIKGISLMTANFANTVKVQYSYDNINFTEEEDLSAWLNTDYTALYNGLEEEKKLYLHFILYTNATFTQFQITYIN